MKKYSWLLALFCVITLLFVGCGGGGGNSDSGGDGKVKSVSLRSTLELPPGGEFKLVPTFSPSNAKNKNVTWESDDTDVATVANDGTVKVAGTASDGDTVTITVTTEDGGHTATCAITVKEDAEIPLAGVVPSSTDIYGDYTMTTNTTWIPEVGTVNTFTGFPTFNGEDIASANGKYLDILFEDEHALDISGYDKIIVRISDGWGWNLWIEGILLTGRSHTPIPSDNWGSSKNLNTGNVGAVTFDLSDGEDGLDAVTGIRLFNCNPTTSANAPNPHKITRVYVE